MLLNNQQVIEEIKKEIKICIETNENENTTTQNLWDTVKAVLRGRVIAIQAYLKKQEKSQINNSTPKATREGRAILLKLSGSERRWSTGLGNRAEFPSGCSFLWRGAGRGLHGDKISFPHLHHTLSQWSFFLTVIKVVNFHIIYTYSKYILNTF